MLTRGSTESSPADPEPTVASGWPTGADQVQKAQKSPKTRNANAKCARLPVTATRYRKPKKIPQNFPRAAGSGGLKMRMANHLLQVSRSHREATGTKCAQVHGMQHQRQPQVGPDLRAGRLRAVGGTPQSLYHLLREIWLDLGCDHAVMWREGLSPIGPRQCTCRDADGQLRDAATIEERKSWCTTKFHVIHSGPEACD
jgi:hypothetical protein